MSKLFLFLGAINGFLAVGLGAFGAHGLKGKLNPQMMEVYHTGGQYHMTHALALLAVGIVGMLFWPAVLNVGMVLGLMPVIGVPLPFISYGGSALVASLISVGLLMNVSLRRWVF